MRQSKKTLRSLTWRCTCLRCMHIRLHAYSSKVIAIFLKCQFVVLVQAIHSFHAAG